MSDIEKIKVEKSKLENQISEMIIKFEAEHKVQIECITFYQPQVMGRVFPKTTNVKIII
jgi:hypothetical protein